MTDVCQLHVLLSAVDEVSRGQERALIVDSLWAVNQWLVETTMVTSTSLNFHVYAASSQWLEYEILLALKRLVIIILKHFNRQQSLIDISARDPIKVDLLSVLY